MPPSIATPLARLLLLAAGCLLLLSRPLPADAAGELETGLVEHIQIPRMYRLDGSVEAVQEATVSAQTSGQVTDILVDIDDYVERDALVLRIRDTEHKARLDQAEAQRRAAASREAEAQQEFDRIREIFEKKLVSKAEMDKAAATLNTARAEHEAAQAALDQAAEQLGYTQVRAPYAGIVVTRHVEAGEMVQPGQPLLTGISLELLRVGVDVPQSMINAVRQANPGVVHVPEQGWVVADRLTVFPVAEPGSNTFKVRLKLPDGIKGLFPGMLVKVAFVIGEQEALVVPEQAVVYRSEVTGVYRVDPEGNISLRHVRLGQHLPNGQRVVLSGLSAGERVALDPIAAGAALKAAKRTNHD